MKYILLILLPLIILSCNKDKYENKLLQTTIKTFGKDVYNYKYIIIIPNSGCTGCIQTAELFLKENINRVC
jgi:hypothetical protein